MLNSAFEHLMREVRLMLSFSEKTANPHWRKVADSDVRSTWKVLVK